MIVLCLGMPGSASTWTFNVVRDILRASFGQVAAFEATSLATADLAVEGMPGAVAIRAHTATHGMLALLAAAGARFVLTTRDPRDGVASLCQRLGRCPAAWSTDMARSLAAVAAAQARTGTVPYAYEDGFAAAPGTVPAMAAGLGLRLPAEEAARIAAARGVERVRALVAGLDEGGEGTSIGWWRTDPGTGFNQAHLGDGRSGKWLEGLEDPEAARLDRAFGGLARPQEGARPGQVLRFTEALFGTAARPPRSANLPAATPFGLRLISLGYLGTGRWRIALRGSLPADPAPRWLHLFVGGVRHLHLPIPGAGSGVAAATLAGGVDIDHHNHEAQLEVVLEGATVGLPDPHRPDALEVEAMRI